MKIKSLLSLSLVSLTLAACGAQTHINQETASRIGMPAFMVERFLPTGNFDLNVWERMHRPGQPMTVYIEGDGGIIQTAGKDEFKKIDIDQNPTPQNPVGLHLASRDLSKNLAYIARPCQFIKFPEEKGCSASYWQEKRYAPEVIEGYQTALNEMKARYGTKGIHLVGFGGGANIAAILAGTRDDVLSLRTVAGNLNPAVDQNTVLAGDSMNAINYADQLARIPQHHFVGAADEIITPAYYHSYRQNIGQSDCIHYSLIQDADHTLGWVEKWPELLKLEPQCATVHTDLPPLPDSNYGDYYKGSGYNKGLTRSYDKGPTSTKYSK